MGPRLPQFACALYLKSLSGLLQLYLQLPT